MVHRHRVSAHLLLIGLLALGGLLAGAGPAAAQSAARLYTVEGVPVDVTAGSAVAAREQAYAEGQRAAFRMLMEKLTPESVHGRLPAAPSGAALDALVQGFEVRDERASGVRYIARMVVRFNPAEVQALLDRAMGELALVSRDLALQYRTGNLAGFGRSLRRMRRIADHLGLRTLSQVGDDVSTCLERGDATALSATWARLARTLDQALAGGWDNAD